MQLGWLPALFLAATLAATASCGGTSSPPSTPTITTPIATETATVSTPPTATLSPTPPAGPSTVDGLPVQELTLGDEIPLPPNLVVYYATGGYGKDGGNSDLGRAYRDESGTLHVEDLYTGLPKLGPVYSERFDPETGLGAAAVCTKGSCGLYPGTAGSLAELFTTDDGGVTWTDRGPLPRDTFVMSYDGSTVMVFHFSSETQGPLTYYPYPAAELAKQAPEGAWPMFYQGVGVAWHYTLEGVLGVDVRLADGTLVYSDRIRLVSLQAANPLGSAIAHPFRFRSWAGEIVTEGIARFYIEETSGAADPLAVYRWTGGDLQPVVQLAPRQLLGSVMMPGPQFGVFPAALIDLDARVIHPIAGLAPPSMSVFVRSALVGPVARVTTGADCLNVRTERSSTAVTLGCFRDGVLLRLASDGIQPLEGNQVWLEVLTPDGKKGFASAEFLER